MNYNIYKHIKNLFEYNYSNEEILDNLVRIYNTSYDLIDISKTVNEIKCFKFIENDEFDNFLLVVEELENLDFVNEKGDNPFLYSVKLNKKKNYDFLSKKKNNLNIFNNAEDNAFIFLIKKGYYDDLIELFDKGLDFNFKIEGINSLEFIFKYKIFDSKKNLIQFIENNLYKFNSENLKFYNKNKLKFLLNNEN